EEEAEPLPLLDESYEPDDELVPEAGGEADLNVEELAAAEPDEEAPEPLPELGGGFEAVEEAAERGTEPVELEPTAEIESPVEAAEPEEAREVEKAEEAEEADVDLETFDLGFETVRAKAPPVSVEDLDVEAIISRARQQVSRGLADEALRELHLLSGSDADPDVFRAALGVADEIVRTHDDHVAAMQHRVEYAARIGDRDLLVDRYLDLAGTLERIGSETRARAMYDRVLDLDPDNERAREGLGAAVDEAEEAGEENALDLDAVLREMDPAELEAAVGGEASDASFTAMLDRFKAKVTKATDPGDAGDHYDLGLAFKEMGLIDEAIAEFQTALTGGEEQLKVYEELGQCFVMQGQYNVALKVFNRALQVPGAEPEELLGVYYHLGQCYEELGQRQEAREAYEQVLAIDETFADVPDRMARL
ncbi:MAG: tetratricopeptide repeat protein, partial [Longimicrobiales bacterium]|nr:tetratricopeptide repeat protein [Longimicrobiales bacterium]